MFAKEPIHSAHYLKYNIGNGNIVNNIKPAVQNSQFNTVSIDVFKEFASINPDANNTEEKEIQYDMCPECNVPMLLSGADLNCKICGLVEANVGGNPNSHEATGNTSVKITIGGRRGKFYNVTSDYSKTQKKHILELLIQNNNAYNGFKFSRDILQKAATEYNNIQKIVLDESQPDGTIVQKKFVRRGNIKDEVLSALIYFECVKAGCTRKKKDISAMMKLQSGGFSNGENILRSLYHAGKIEIPIGDEPWEDYLDRYLETLNINNVKYRGFVVAMVDYSEKNKIAMSSQISSKVVGVLWIIITNCRLDIDIDTLERAADGIKKSTFMKFNKIVNANLRIFSHIYARYGIPISPPRGA